MEIMESLAAIVSISLNLVSLVTNKQQQMAIQYNPISYIYLISIGNNIIIDFVWYLPAPTPYSSYYLSYFIFLWKMLLLGIIPFKLTFGSIPTHKRRNGRTPGKVPSQETGTKQPR